MVLNGQDAFHVIRPDDLRRTRRFFSVFGVLTNKKIFGQRKMFVSWCVKHIATYIVNMKKNKIKTHTPQFSLLIRFLCLACNVYSFTAQLFGVPRQVQWWTFGVQLT